MKFLKEKELMQELGVTRQALVNWREAGLPFFKGPLPKSPVWYDIEEVREWLRDNTRVEANGNKVSTTRPER